MGGEREQKFRYKESEREWDYEERGERGQSKSERETEKWIEREKEINRGSGNEKTE